MTLRECVFDILPFLGVQLHYLGVDDLLEEEDGEESQQTHDIWERYRPCGLICDRNTPRFNGIRENMDKSETQKYPSRNAVCERKESLLIRRSLLHTDRNERKRDAKTENNGHSE